MRKKTIGALAVAAIATLSLASCGESGGSTTSAFGSVNVYLNYNGTSGVTFREAKPWTSPMDNLTYSEGSMLPAWKAFAKNTGLSIVDVADYSTETDDDTYKAVSGSNYLTKDGQGIDLFYSKTTNINNMGESGKALDLYPKILEGKMPNFAQYLSDNPEVLETISSTDSKGTHIYYTPYFDGYQSVERMFIMDTQMVERLLNSTTSGDTTIAITPNTNDGSKITYGDRLHSAGAYTQFIKGTEKPTYNFDNDITVPVATSASSATVVNRTVKSVESIIERQNQLLQSKPNVTGAELAAQLRTYLTEAYGDAYKDRLADIYIGQDAIYNADDLVALMRVVRANPEAASGVKGTTSIETLFPRGEDTSRIENIYDFASIWGLQGVDGESGNFYFDGAGNLVNNQSTDAAYDALDKLHELYSEGLIQSTFYNQGSKNKAKYINDYFLNNTENNTKQGFMVYDYSASTTTGNDLDDAGIGTDPASRTGIYNGKSKTGIRPVVTPLSYWNTGVASNTQKLENLTGKTYMRYHESNRALKNTSWCIPSTARNVDGALRLMDYMFTAEGTRINDFGPLEYQGATTDKLVDSQLVPTLNSKILADMKKSTFDFWNYMRRYIGSTNGVGHVREDSLNLQATNASAQTGQKHLDNAIRAGVVTLANVKQAKDYGFGACVPTSWNVSVNATDAKLYEDLTNFWKVGFGNSQWRKMVVEGNTVALQDGGTKKIDDVKAQINQFNLKYVSNYCSELNTKIGGNHTPEWLA